MVLTPLALLLPVRLQVSGSGAVLRPGATDGGGKPYFPEGQIKSAGIAGSGNLLVLPRFRSVTRNVLYGQICQEVCPHNNDRFAQITTEEAFWPRQGVHGERLIELMGMSQEEFSRRFKNSPVKRAKRRGLLRNVAIALGNWGSAEAVPVLVAALEDDEPLVRGHVAWALGKIASRPDCPQETVSACAAAIDGRLSVEVDEWVREELSLALEEASGNGESPPA